MGSVLSGALLAVGVDELPPAVEDAVLDLPVVGVALRHAGGGTRGRRCLAPGPRAS